MQKIKLNRLLNQDISSLQSRGTWSPSATGCRKSLTPSSTCRGRPRRPDPPESAKMAAGRQPALTAKIGARKTGIELESFQFSKTTRETRKKFPERISRLIPQPEMQFLLKKWIRKIPVRSTRMKNRNRNRNLQPSSIWSRFRRKIHRPSPTLFYRQFHPSRFRPKRWKTTLSGSKHWAGDTLYQLQSLESHFYFSLINSNCFKERMMNSLITCGLPSCG